MENPQYARLPFANEPLMPSTSRRRPSQRSTCRPATPRSAVSPTAFSAISWPACVMVCWPLRATAMSRKSTAKPCEFSSSSARRTFDGTPLLGRAGQAPRHRAGAAQRVRAEPSPESCRASSEDDRQGHRLHAVACARRKRPLDRRGAVFQGPHQGRAARRTRAPARSPRGARRDGGGDRARGEEPARRHRSDGGPAETPCGHHRFARRAVAA